MCAASTEPRSRGVSEDELVEFDDGPSVGVRGIAEDKHGKFWFSDTSHRFDVYPADSTAQARGAAKYRREPGLGDLSAKKSEAPYSYFVSGLKGRDEALWLATYGSGVWRYDGHNLTGYPVADPNARLYSIFEDNAGVLWVGSTGSGAYRFNGKAFERFRP